MLEYVYALHDFQPEHDDEVNFLAGERIEVIEKDDEFGDGWWQGRNLAGKIGLFPQSYTTSAPPAPYSPLGVTPTTSLSTTDSRTSTDTDHTYTGSTSQPSSQSPDSYPDLNQPKSGGAGSTILQPLREESEPELSPPALYINGDGYRGGGEYTSEGGGTTADGRYGIPAPSGDGEVMKATMTDVQKAIEQLGRGRPDHDGDRSFSFASTNDGTEGDTETDTDLDTDAEGTPSELGVSGSGEDWHKSAREKLAAKARKAVEEAEKLEAMMSNKSHERLKAPPIDVEISDESDEGDDEVDVNDTTHRSQMRISTVAEEEEEEEERDEGKGKLRIGVGLKPLKLLSQASPQEESPRRYDFSPNTTSPRRASQESSKFPMRSFSIPREDEHGDNREDQLLTATRANFDSTNHPQTPNTVASPSPKYPSFLSQKSISANETHQDTGVASSPAVETFGNGNSPQMPGHKRVGSGPPQGTVGPALASPLSTLESIGPKRVASGGSTGIGLGVPPSGMRNGTPLSSYSVRTATPPPALNTIVSAASTTTRSTLPSNINVASIKAAGSLPAAMTIHTSGLSSAASAPASLTTSSTLQTSVSGGGGGSGDKTSEAGSDSKEKKHPSDWTVDDVVDWLRSKGFDKDVCDKFTEQEITGDVLLELDANLLKSELGIMAFGKRVRIANAISDLRRPPSVVYSDPASPQFAQVPAVPRSFALNGHPPSQPASPHNVGHSRNQSSSYSLGYPHSTHSSGSPFANQPGSAPPHPGFGEIAHRHHSAQQTGFGLGTGVTREQRESAAISDMSGMSYSVVDVDDSMAGAVAMGLGLGQAETSLTTTDEQSGRLRSAQLTLSPSDSALGQTARAELPERTDEERGVMSESEVTQNSVRRRFFGQSTKDKSVRNSVASHNSKEATSPLSSNASPTPRLDVLSDMEEKGKDIRDGTASLRSRHSRKKSGENVRPGDRLSLFGSTFGATIGKGRKPPPRYSSNVGDSEASDKNPVMSLSRFVSSKKGTVRDRQGSGKEYKNARESSKERERDAAVLRKRSSSSPQTERKASSSNDASTMLDGPDSPKTSSATAGPSTNPLKSDQSIWEQIGEADHAGWMRKRGDRYNNWKMRYFLLKGPHLYCLRSSSKSESKLKGYINIIGYRVIADENLDPGRYGFKIVHDNDKTHFFSSEEKSTIREWMKAIMKATIGRDYTRPVVSSVNIPTIPLVVAQAMNPAPRPPSPTARDATQRALRRENTNQLSSRDARVLMGIPGGDPGKLDEIYTKTDISSEGHPVNSGQESLQDSVAPPRPSRELRRLTVDTEGFAGIDPSLVEWANSHLPKALQMSDPGSPPYGGLALLRIAEDIKGRASSPPVPDSAFPTNPNDDKLDGLFKLFDFLLDHDVKMGSVSINDVRQGKPDKIVQLLRALKAWEDKRRTLAQSIGKSSSVQSGGLVGGNWT